MDRYKIKTELISKQLDLFLKSIDNLKQSKVR